MGEWKFHSPLLFMRAFVIGNGKSLLSTDLDLIVGQPSYACNRINLIYPLTNWRPTVYVHPESLAPDIPFIQENIDTGIECWIGEHFQEKIYTSEKVHWIKDCHHHLLNWDNKDLPDEWHFPQPCSFGGSVSWSMQRAILDGFDEIVLLGCDLEYRNKKPSHFNPGYEHGGEQPAYYASRNAWYGHVQGLNYIRRKKLNVKIYNATRGGLLEIWERKELKELLNG